MVKHIRKIVKGLLFRFLAIFGPGFSNPRFPVKLLIQHVLLQKMLRVNSHVPWPVHWTSQVKCPERIERGTRCPGLAIGCYLDGRNGITIGKNTWIGPRCSLISRNHNRYDYQEYEGANPIIIGDNCWLATNVVILSGVQLGDHTVVAAASVVTKSFPEGNVLLAGVPARVVQELGPYQGKLDEL
jgi:acetyltransferase-like isoleucine patch superfamily enzyme